MILCPACGKENDDSAVLCRRCRGPLRDEPEEDLAAEAQLEPAHHEPPATAHANEQPAATADEPTASSDSLGEVCRRCESYNEPGARRCGSCGYVLIPEDAPSQHEPVHHTPALDEELPLDKTPAQPFAPPHLAAEDEGAPAHDTPAEGSRSVADELSAFTLSPEEAAEAGLSTPPGNGVGGHAHGQVHHEMHAHEEGPPLDKTPSHGFEPPPAEVPAPSLMARSKVMVADAAGVAIGAATGVAVGAAAVVAGAVRRTPEPPTPPPAARSEPEPKACPECGERNPPAARFCFDCGTPFAKKSAAPPPQHAQPPQRAAEPQKAVEARQKIFEPPLPLAAEVKRAAPLRIEPLPRNWADTTAPGNEASSIHVEGLDLQSEGLDSTTETAPVAAEQHQQDVSPVHADATALQGANIDEPHAVPHDEPGIGEPPAFESERHAEVAPVEAAAALEEPFGAEHAAPFATWEELPVEELADPLPELEPPVEELVEPLPEVEPPPVEELVEPLPEVEPPFHASLVLEKGPAAGTALLLGRIENSVGGAGALIELADDPSVAPHAATVAFADDRLVLRDEGSANGVSVRVRESTPIEPGDHFFAGERLLRFDGPCELPQTHEGEVPFLGAPRPPGPSVRVTEVVAGGKTGRTCHRSGPTISIGRTGCDMNFPADSLLGARHAELRLGEDGTVSLIDLGQGPSGVFLRVRARGTQELRAGDVLRVGDQELRVEIG